VWRLWSANCYIRVTYFTNLETLETLAVTLTLTPSLAADLTLTDLPSA